MDYRYAVEADVPAMAGLLAAHHHDALTERERAERGFIQGDFDADTLRAMAGRRTLLVADDDGQLAGLLGLASPEQLPGPPPPPVRALLDAQDALWWRGRPLGATSWLSYGPVVVATGYRGRGVARGLFTAARREAAEVAEVMVAFIELVNRTSWRVHVDGFGMTPLGGFTLGDRAYGVVGVSTGPSAASGG